MSTLYRIWIQSSRLHFWSHLEGTWDKDPQEYNLLSVYRWLVKEDYSDLEDMLRDCVLQWDGRSESITSSRFCLHQQLSFEH